MSLPRRTSDSPSRVYTNERPSGPHKDEAMERVFNARPLARRCTGCGNGKVQRNTPLLQLGQRH
eukprot:11209280-Lingulodinium_polyedra.AAC.1